MSMRRRSVFRRARGGRSTRALAPGERFTRRAFAAEDTDFVRMNRGKVRQPGTSRSAIVDDPPDPRRAPRGARAVAARATRRRSRRRRATPSPACATRCPSSPTIRTCCCPTDVRRRAQRTRRSAAAVGSDRRRRSLRRGARPRPRRLLRGGPGLSRLRELGRPAQLARDHDVQPAMEPVPPRRQGGEGVVRRLRVERRGARANDGAIAREQLALIARPPKSLAPGKYRAYLAPAAMRGDRGTAVLGRILRRARSRRSKARSRGCSSGARLDPRVHDLSRTSRAASRRPSRRKASRGPARVPLIDDGTLVGALVSPRTAREFGLEANGANGAESPEALAMQGGIARDARRARRARHGPLRSATSGTSTIPIGPPAG